MSFLNKEHEDGKVNHPFLKKLPDNAEAAVILTGSVPFLERPVSVFIRLAQPSVLGDLPEVDIPTRLVFLDLVSLVTSYGVLKIITVAFYMLV